MKITKIRCPNREHYLGLMLNGWCSWCRRSVIEAKDGLVFERLSQLKALV